MYIKTSNTNYFFIIAVFAFIFTIVSSCGKITSTDKNFEELTSTRALPTEDTETKVIENYTDTQTVEPANEDNPIFQESISDSVFVYSEQCLSISLGEEYVFEDKSGGLIVNRGELGRSNGEIDLLDISDGTYTPVIEVGNLFHQMRFSPNKSLMAYELVTNNGDESKVELIIRDFENVKEFRIPWDNKSEKIKRFGKWVNNQTIIIKEYEEYPQFIDTWNIVDDKKTIFPFTFPYQESNEKKVNYQEAEYNATFQYVIYPSIYEGKEGYILMDRQSQQIVSFIPTKTLMTNSSPMWNSDGNAFILSAKAVNEKNYKFELYYGVTSGEVKKITDLSGYRDSYYIHNIVWSPDDSYVAFVLTNTEATDGKYDELMILNMDKQELINPCISFNTTNWRFGEYTNLDYPVWSPDSNELIIENQFDFDRNEVILINLHEMSANIIARNQRILGWVKFGK